jgi:hypothetical protein
MKIIPAYARAKFFFYRFNAFWRRRRVCAKILLGAGYIKIPCLPFALMMAKQYGDLEVLQEIEELCIIHQKITQSSECRDFNHRAALLLQSLEEKGFFPLADRMMDLLACCNPKDLSQCDSVQRARDILERLRYLARQSLEDDRK